MDEDLQKEMNKILTKEKLIKFIVKVMQTVNQDNFLTVGQTQEMEIKKISQLVNEFLLINPNLTPKDNMKKQKFINMLTELYEVIPSDNKKLWSKRIYFRRISLLLTNYLHLGFSIHKRHTEVWINLFTCQVVINTFI